MSLSQIPILSVAERLGLTIRYTLGASQKCLCPFHDDHNPSMHIWPKSNRWKCFSCDKSGNVIDLAMELLNLPFKETCEWLEREYAILPSNSYSKKRNKTILQHKYHAVMTTSVDNKSHSYIPAELLTPYENTDNELTRALVQCGILTAAQMRHAANRYRIGSDDDAVVFWQIDEEHHFREGKVMHYQADGHRSHQKKPYTLSWVWKKEKLLPLEWRATPCLFGLHLLEEEGRADSPVAIVESEKTAMICSEYLPDALWMATGGMSNLSLAMLFPLKGRKIILFPDTDITGATYQRWTKEAEIIAKSLGTPVYVSDLLEKNATEEMKEKKIDLADYLMMRR